MFQKVDNGYKILSIKYRAILSDAAPTISVQLHLNTTSNK